MRFIIFVGDYYKGDKVIKVCEKDNVFATESYNKVACRWEVSFYYLDTQKHWFTRGY